MQDPLLTVIVPVYNAAPWLLCCLDSMVGQTYRNLEIICVNDGSTDNSAEILAEYAARDSRIKVIYQKNAGVSAARNAGLDAATGEFVTFVDADDWVEPEAYEMVLHAMKPDVDMAWFGTLVDGAASEGYRRALEHHFRVGKTGVQRLTPCKRSSMGGEAFTKLFRRVIIEQCGLRFLPGLTYGEDKAFTYPYILMVSKVLFVAENLYHYRIHSLSAMRRYAEQKNHGPMARRVFEHVLEFALQHGVKMNHAHFVMALLYDEYLDVAVPGADDKERCRLYREGTAMGILTRCHTPSALALRHEYRAWWERPFHGYIQNREYFGIGRFRFWSITYEFSRRAHRCLGFYICSIPNKK